MTGINAIEDHQIGIVTPVQNRTEGVQCNSPTIYNGLKVIESNCLDENEILIPVDYIYKNVILPLIFVNPSMCGISICDQVLLVQNNIQQVIEHFVHGNITPCDATIVKFFQSNPGTMIYSPQLLKTVVSLQYCDLDNMQFTRRKQIPSPSRIRTSHEE